MAEEVEAEGPYPGGEARLAIKSTPGFFIRPNVHSDIGPTQTLGLTGQTAPGHLSTWTIGPGLMLEQHYRMMKTFKIPY